MVLSLQAECCMEKEDMSKLQKAWLYYEHGSVDVLQFGEVPVPKPGPTQVLIKIRAAALNPVDFKRRLGLFSVADSDLPTVPGCDAAGVVVEVGDGVTKFKNGDEVYTDIHDFGAGRPKQWGTLAQFTAVEEYLVAPKPKNLSFEEAASLPLALLTAQQAFDIAKFEEGKSVFIVGGAGGVSSLAIQLAENVYGASSIVATSNTGKLEFVRGLGHDVVIDYNRSTATIKSLRKDFVFDTIGDSAKSQVVYKEEAKILEIASFQPHRRLECFGASPHAQNLEKLQPYIEREKLKPVIDPKGPYSFTDVKEAFKRLESGRARGKVIISPIE